MSCCPCCEEYRSFDVLLLLFSENVRASRVARYRGVALVRPYPSVREIAKSRNQNYEIAISESRNRGIAKSQNRGIAKERNRGIAKSKNRGITESRNREIAESRIGIGNRNRKRATSPRIGNTSARIGNLDLESEITIGIRNRKLEIANVPRQIRSSSPSRRKHFCRRFDGIRSRV